ncbi:MAG: hypothetical protein E7214_11170 [Clostridium sp.]|nr:hypothetical protein [Clostridium sp.]
MEDIEVTQEDLEDEVPMIRKEHEYEKNIRQIRRVIKRQLLRMSTKEEKLDFLREEKIKYTMLKENSSTSALIEIVICFTTMFVDLLLFGSTESIILKILSFLILGAASGVAGYLISNMNVIKSKYTSVLMLLDNLEDKISGSMWQSDTAYEMQKKIDDLQYDIKLLSEQMKINSKSVEKAMDEMQEFMTYRR